MSFASRARSWLPLLPLLGILAVSYWLDRQTQPEADNIDRRKQHTADAIVDNLKAVTLNKQGTPHFVMSARQLVHYSDDDSTDLSDPEVTAFTPMRPDVHMTSRRGTLSSNGDVIELMDEVKITRAAGKSGSELLVRSNYVKVIPDDELVSSDRAVTVTQDHSIINAVGMEMDNRAQIIKLLAKVRATNAVTQN